jgi:hypothetical protein
VTATIIAIAGLAGLLYLVFGLYNDLRIDLLRQDLFQIRDDLFDQAAAGDIAFSSPSYRVTRATLNGLIRFGHRVSLSGMLVTVYQARRGGLKEVKELISTARRASPERDRVRCAAVMDRAHQAIARHMGRAPLLWILVVPALLVMAGVVNSRRAVQFFKPQLAEIDASAYGAGAVV